MNGHHKGPSIVMTMDHEGVAQVQHCYELTEGMTGLLLAEVAASFCAQNPATPDDRAQIEKARR